MLRAIMPPRPAGSKEGMAVQVKPGTCYFAVRSEDGQPNRGKMSNVVKLEVQ